MDIDYNTFDPELWDEVLEELGVYEMPFEVHYILDLLEGVGYNTDAINQEMMFEILESEDWDNFVIDRWIVEAFLDQMGIDYTQFDQSAYELMLIELGIVEMPYEVHYILDLLDYVGFDTDTIVQEEMFAVLEGTDWDNFVLDQTVIEDFFSQLGIDVETFNQTAYQEVLDELLYIYLPYDVHYILDILDRVGYEGWEDLSQTDMYNWLASIDWEGFYLDEYAMNEFFA